LAEEIIDLIHYFGEEKLVIVAEHLAGFIEKVD
jgi:hypothetical protein